MLVLSFCLGHFTSAQLARASLPPSSIIATEDGRFRFLIDGKEVAYLDKNGLAVRDDISYGGALTDQGTAEFDKRAAAQIHAQ